jgi:hypothetical protein
MSESDLCAQVTIRQERPPRVTLFVVDASASIAGEQSESLWEALIATLAAYFEQPDRAQEFAALSVFPRSAGASDAAGDAGPDAGNSKTAGANGATCDASTYTTLSAGPVELPSDELRTTLESAASANPSMTPLGAAYAGAAEIVRAMHAERPEARYQLVLITDGLAEGCHDESQAAVTLVAEQAAALIDIATTLVLAVESERDDDGARVPTAWEALDEIARAGGSQPLLFDPSDPEESALRLRDALTPINSEVQTCAIEMPTPPQGSTLDLDRVKVSLTIDEVTTELPQRHECADGSGWRFDDERDPTLIELCPATCDQVLSANGSVRLDVAIRCQTPTSDPP